MSRLDALGAADQPHAIAGVELLVQRCVGNGSSRSNGRAIVAPMPSRVNSSGSPVKRSMGEDGVRVSSVPASVSVQADERSGAASG